MRCLLLSCTSHTLSSDLQAVAHNNDGFAFRDKLPSRDVAQSVLLLVLTELFRAQTSRGISFEDFICQFQSCPDILKETLVI